MTDNPTLGAVPDLITPQISLKIMDVPQPDGETKQVMLMMVETASTHYEFLIATPENYKDVARTLLDSVLKFGAQFRESQRGLVVVKGGLPDGLKNGHPRSSQRGQHRR